MITIVLIIECTARVEISQFPIPVSAVDLVQIFVVNALLRFVSFAIIDFTDFELSDSRIPFVVAIFRVKDLLFAGLSPFEAQHELVLIWKARHSRIIQVMECSSLSTNPVFPFPV